MTIVFSTTEEEAGLIFADPSEQRGLREILGEVDITFLPELESWTGADIMVTRLKVPVVPALLTNHVASGAFLIQRKSGQDLVSSLGERMNESLVRMKRTGAHQAQCVLLFIGTLACNIEGDAVINGRTSPHGGHQNYWAVAGALAKWGERGGVVEQISRPGLLPKWLKMKEQHLEEFAAERSRNVYQEPDVLFASNKDDPLQELVQVKDWRNTLLTIPGLGPKRVEALYQRMSEAGTDMRLATAIAWLTTWEQASSIPGIGKGLFRSILNWFGLEDGYELSVRLIEREVSNE